MHSKVISGGNGQYTGLQGIERWTNPLIDVISKGIQGTKCMFKMSLNRSTFKSISKRCKDVFWQARYMMLLSQVPFEHACLIEVSIAFCRPGRPEQAEVSGVYIHGWHNGGNPA